MSKWLFFIGVTLLAAGTVTAMSPGRAHGNFADRLTAAEMASIRGGTGSCYGIVPKVCNPSGITPACSNTACVANGNNTWKCPDGTSEKVKAMAGVFLCVSGHATGSMGVASTTTEYCSKSSFCTGTCTLNVVTKKYVCAPGGTPKLGDPITSSDCNSLPCPAGGARLQSPLGPTLAATNGLGFNPF